MPTVGLHTLHYARSPFYCTVRIGSRTVESARVSLLTECGPCSPACSPGAGVARNPTLQRRQPFSFECRRSGVEYTLRVANPDGIPKGSCTLAAPPEAGAVYACRPRQNARSTQDLHIQRPARPAGTAPANTNTNTNTKYTCDTGQTRNKLLAQWVHLTNHAAGHSRPGTARI
jgi:hypothetical protein